MDKPNIRVMEIHTAVAQLAQSERGRRVLVLLRENRSSFGSLDSANQAATIAVVASLVRHWPMTADLLLSLSVEE